MNERSRDRFQTIQEFWQALNKDEGLFRYEYVNSNKNTFINIPSINKISQEDTLIENRTKRIKPIPVAFYKPEPSKSREKTLLGLSGIVAVLVVIFFIAGGMKITEFVEHKRFPVKRNYVPVAVVETPVHNQDTMTQIITQQPVSQPINDNNESKIQLEQTGKEKEKLRKEKEDSDKWDAINLVQQANNVFINKSLGSTRFEQSHQLYLKAKELKGDVSSGYNNYLSLAISLIENGSGFDSNVKKMLLYAQKLNNTQEVRDLIAKCD